MVVKRNIQPGELSESVASGERRKMQNTEGIATLYRLVQYCEAEASDLKLSFVAYCLSIAIGALEEVSGGDEPPSIAAE